jgi:hypothetical protein
LEFHSPNTFTIPLLACFLSLFICLFPFFLVC